MRMIRGWRAGGWELVLVGLLALLALCALARCNTRPWDWGLHPAVNEAIWRAWHPRLLEQPTSRPEAERASLAVGADREKARKRHD